MPELRPYQAKNAAEILALVQRKVPGIVYFGATGSGKTVLASSVARSVYDAGKTVWFFAHRKELIDQISRALIAAGVPHGIIDADHDYDGQRVQVCSVDTISARLGKLATVLAGVDLGIFDEVHHVVAAGWSRIAWAVGGVRLGLSATPYRMDGKPLGTDNLFTEVVHGPSIRQLIGMGSLSPFAVFAPPIAIDLHNVRKSRGDYVIADLEGKMDREDVRREAIRSYAKYVPGDRCAVFCVSVASAHNMAKAFTDAGWNAVAVDGTMSKTDRDAAIQGLVDGRYHVICSCNLISEGWDVPGLVACILARPTQSTPLFLQQVGRVSRPAPGKSAGVVIDLSHNVAKHGMPDEDRKWSLDGGLKTEDRVVLATRRCRHCHHVTAKGPMHCPWCAREYPVSPITATRGAVKGLGRPAVYGAGACGYTADQISRMSLDQLKRLGKTRADFEAIAKIRGYNAKWVWYQMQALQTKPRWG